MSAGQRRSLRLRRCPIFRWAPRDGPFSHPPHSTQEPFLTPSPQAKRISAAPPPRNPDSGEGCLPCAPRGAHLAASEASSLDAQRPRDRETHAHGEPTGRQLWPWTQTWNAGQEPPAPASLRGTPIAPWGASRPSPCGAGAGSGCVAWHTRGRVEAAAVSVCVSVTRPPPSM